MSYVLGIAEKPFGEELVPLTRRVTIASQAYFLQGYLNEIAPAFQEFAARGEDILALHCFASISSEQFDTAKKICARLKKSLYGRPSSWRLHLGSIKIPGQPERVFAPLVVKRRALAIVDHIERLLLSAREAGGTVVFAGGAWYVPLCGIELPPGTVHYS